MHTAQKIFNGNRKLPANETEAPDYVKENGTLQSNILLQNSWRIS